MTVAPPPPRSGLWSRFVAVLGRLGPTVPLLGVATVGPIVGVVLLAATAATWQPWFGDDAGSVVAFWLGGAVAAAACLLPTHATSLVAGYLFGSLLGASVAWLVVVLAASLSFALWHRLVGARAVHALVRSPRAVAVHGALVGRGFWRTVWVIALMRLSPVLPFAATNLLMAAFGVRVLPFLCATVVGTTPRAIGAAVVGAELSALDWQADLGGWSTWLAIAATVLAVVVVGRIARRALQREVGTAR